MSLKAIVQKAAFSRFARTLYIGDIHGDLPLLKRLLDTVCFCSDDALVLVGDLLEKGDCNLAALRFVMQMADNYNVWYVSGNCETELLARLQPENAADLHNYMELRRPCRSLLWDMSAEAGLDALYEQDILSFQQEIEKHFSPELRFLRTLPTIVESEDCIAVHAGLEHTEFPGMTQKSCVRQTAWFAQDGPRFAKTVIVGHWPVVLYDHRFIRSNPRYNARRNIFAIDGGCMVHEDGQLNCLIHDNTTGCWSFAACDNLLKAIALSPQSPQKGFCFLWGDNTVEALSENGSFTRCRHRRTGYEAEIPTQLLYKAKDGMHVSNFTSAEPAVFPGDIVSVFLSTERGFYIKKDGVSGWYYGELKFQ